MTCFIKAALPASDSESLTFSGMRFLIVYSVFGVVSGFVKSSISTEDPGFPSVGCVENATNAAAAATTTSSETPTTVAHVAIVLRMADKPRCNLLNRVRGEFANSRNRLAFDTADINEISISMLPQEA